MPPSAGRASIGVPPPFVRSCLGVRERPRMGVGTGKFFDLSLVSLPRHMQSQLQPLSGSFARGEMVRRASSGELPSKARSPRWFDREVHMLCWFEEVADVGLGLGLAVVCSTSDVVCVSPQVPHQDLSSPSQARRVFQCVSEVDKCVSTELEEVRERRQARRGVQPHIIGPHPPDSTLSSRDIHVTVKA